VCVRFDDTLSIVWFLTSTNIKHIGEYYQWQTVYIFYVVCRLKDINLCFC